MKTESQSDLKKHSKPTSLTNLLSLRNLLSVPRRISRTLNLLAQSPNIHTLPPTDTLHFLEELPSRLTRIHISRNVLIEHRALLEDTDAIVVRAYRVVRVFQGLGDAAIRVDEDI